MYTTSSKYHAFQDDSYDLEVKRAALSKQLVQAGTLQETRATANLSAHEQESWATQGEECFHTLLKASAARSVFPQMPGFRHSTFFFFCEKYFLKKMFCFFRFMPRNRIIKDLHTQGLFQSLTIRNVSSLKPSGLIKRREENINPGMK